MARRRFAVWNGASSALTAAITGSATGAAAVKTMLQLKPTTVISIIEWGYSFASVPTVPVQVELVSTSTVAATVTASVAGDLIKYGDSSGATSAASIGTTNTGYTASAEGTVTSTRLLAYQYELGQSFKQQFALEREPQVLGSDFLRIRATTATSINMICYIVWEE